MNAKKEIKTLSLFAKKILDKNRFLKIKDIKDLDEKRHLFEYAIKRELELKVMDFRKRIKELHRQEKDIFFIRVKINLLKHKINYFIVEPKKRGFKKIMRLIKIIERDLKNV